MAAHQPRGAHQPRDPLAAHVDAAGELQLGMDPGSAIGAAALAVDAADLPKQPRIGQLPGGEVRRCQS